MQNERLEKLERMALGNNGDNSQSNSSFNLLSLFSTMKGSLISSDQDEFSPNWCKSFAIYIDHYFSLT